MKEEEQLLEAKREQTRLLKHMVKQKPMKIDTPPRPPLLAFAQIPRARIPIDDLCDISVSKQLIWASFFSCVFFPFNKNSDPLSSHSHVVSHLSLCSDFLSQWWPWRQIVITIDWCGSIWKWVAWIEIFTPLWKSLWPLLIFNWRATSKVREETSVEDDWRVSSFARRSRYCHSLRGKCSAENERLVQRTTYKVGPVGIDSTQSHLCGWSGNSGDPFLAIVLCTRDGYSSRKLRLCWSMVSASLLGWVIGQSSLSPQVHWEIHSTVRCNSTSKYCRLWHSERITPSLATGAIYETTT